MWLLIYVLPLDCGPLTAPEHGSVALVGGTTVGALAVYECEDGYYLDGPDPRECLLTGTWSLDKPVCIESGKYSLRRQMSRDM